MILLPLHFIKGRTERHVECLNVYFHSTVSIPNPLLFQKSRMVMPAANIMKLSPELTQLALEYEREWNFNSLQQDGQHHYSIFVNQIYSVLH